MGVYCINATRYLFQDEPTEVLASSASSEDPKFRNAGEMVSVMLRFPGERLATFTCTLAPLTLAAIPLSAQKER